MGFASVEFIVFLLASVLLFYVVPVCWRKTVLLAESIVFLFLASTGLGIYSFLCVFVNYLSAMFVSRSARRSRVLVYYTTQTLNIGGLILYKYLFFFITSFFGFRLFEIPHSVTQWVVPLGISYYTFQAVSYQYLVFKAKDKPSNDLVDFGLYMLFFPKITAGPIERHRLFLPQLEKPLLFDAGAFVTGLRLLLAGMFLKVVIGDTFGIVINKVHADLGSFHGIALWLVFLIQPVRLYCDFSGYTLMAIGIAKLFGIVLSPNFNRPFFAVSVGEFWRRWHISLSSWCNDFIYNRILVKRRKWGNKAVFYATFVTFSVVGLWHGARWTYFIVGLLQVVALLYEFRTKAWRNKLKNYLPPGIVLWGSRMLVFLFVCFFHVFFFSEGWDDTLLFLSKMFSFPDGFSTSIGINLSRNEFYFAVMALGLNFWYEYGCEKGRNWVNWQRFPIVIRWLFYFVGLLAVVYFSKNQNVFVYGQF